MRDLDAQAMSRYEIPGQLLMENAGGAVYYVILHEMGVVGHRFTVLSGPGNNGGDGFVVARKLHSTGAQVRVLLFCDPSSYSEPARGNLRRLEMAGVEVSTDPALAEVSSVLAEGDAVVDGLLGTGLKGEVAGRMKDVIGLVNDSKKPVFSIDIPSGVDGNTGEIRGAAIRATWTIAFGLPKRGNLLGHGPECGGRLFVSHISFPPELIAKAGIEVETNEPVLLPFPGEGRSADSGGDIFFVAGARNPIDSTAFSSMALVEVAGSPARFAVPRSLVSAMEGLSGKIILVPQDETDTGTFALSSLEKLLSLGQQADLVILGPGVSPSEETRELTRRLCEELEGPLLLNGNIFPEGAGDLALVGRRRAPTIWLLQPPEMARLSNSMADKSGKDPIASVQTLCAEADAIVVLRSRPVLIGLPEGRVFVDLTDRFLGSNGERCNVLPGLIGAMTRLGLPPEEAVRNGVFLRGVAGDLAAQRAGEEIPTGRQIVQALPVVIKALREDFSGTLANLHGTMELV
jgi:NAD(P)H-hydrate epimerase